MKILITGNLGYIGPVLVSYLRTNLPAARLSGFDTGFFAHCLTDPRFFPEVQIEAQFFGDLRHFPGDLLKDVDAVVHLAAISNDPMGKNFESATLAINHQAGIELARKAKESGVSRFVFASSCSVYGFAEGEARTEMSPLDPLTAYARSKVYTEGDLRPLSGPDFVVTCLRFATACGMSPRLRLDLVLNDFVASALATGRIQILSDGTPWRPLIHVRDMARAIHWGLTRELENGGGFLVVNTGSNEWNYQIKTLAEAVANRIPGTSISINTAALPDKRSYKVDFTQFQNLAPEFQPEVTLDAAIQDLEAGLKKLNFADADFRNSQLIRLNTLRSLQKSNLLSDNLEWKT
jgi:nucleoside-diphosphate-sugar epimerase